MTRIALRALAALAVLTGLVAPAPMAMAADCEDDDGVKIQVLTDSQQACGSCSAGASGLWLDVLSSYDQSGCDTCEYHGPYVGLFSERTSC